MEDNLIRITPDKNKAKSLLKMVETTLEMISKIDVEKFPSNVTKEYYEIIRELLSVVLLLDGYKTYGEGAHKRLIEYIEANYKEFNRGEILFIDELRTIRNKIAYDGFFVDKDYILRKTNEIGQIINKLKNIINKKID
ncbi:MAG TPA: hypothetical protein VJB94_01000 [Candidatus Nanoarchaeia archaeon]|nr:hypothetical protein [Candidatus Nanoarchaeia archaeon]